MADHRAVYAARFNDRRIRPRRTVTTFVDEVLGFDLLPWQREWLDRFMAAHHSGEREPCGDLGPIPFPQAMAYQCSLPTEHVGSHEAWSGGSRTSFVDEAAVVVGLQTALLRKIGLRPPQQPAVPTGEQQ